MNDGRITVISPWVMLISAAIFGYFGFGARFVYTGSQGQFLLFVALYVWTLRGGAIVFFISGVLGFIAPLAASFIYGAAGVLAAVGLAVAGVLDLQDQQHTVQDPFLTFLFAFIIAIVSGASLRDAIASYRTAAALRASEGSLGDVDADSGDRM